MNNRDDDAQRTDDSGGQESLPPRPRWLRLFNIILFLYGGSLLLSGLDGLKLGGFSSTWSLPSGFSVGSIEELVVRGIGRAAGTTDKTFPVLAQTVTISRLVLAGLLLFGAVAISMADVRARVVVMVSAGVGAAYHIGNAIVTLLVVRPQFLASPAWQELARDHSDNQAIALNTLSSTRELAGWILLINPLAAGFVGSAFAVLLIRYFGGKKGRAYYDELNQARARDIARIGGGT